jgi:hypothetical protein
MGPAMGWLERLFGLDEIVQRLSDDRAALDAATFQLQKRADRLEALERKLKPQLDLESEALGLRASNNALRGAVKIQRAIALAAQAVLAESPAVHDTDAMRALRATIGGNVYKSDEVTS